jgi:hypothetical protein
MAHYNAFVSNDKAAYYGSHYFGGSSISMKFPSEVGKLNTTHLS